VYKGENIEYTVDIGVEHFIIRDTVGINHCNIKFGASPTNSFTIFYYPPVDTIRYYYKALQII